MEENGEPPLKKRPASKAEPEPPLMKRPASKDEPPLKKRPAGDDVQKAAQDAYNSAYKAKFESQPDIEMSVRRKHAQHAGQRARAKVLNAA